MVSHNQAILQPQVVARVERLKSKSLRTVEAEVTSKRMACYWWTLTIYSGGGAGGHFLRILSSPFLFRYAFRTRSQTLAVCISSR